MNTQATKPIETPTVEAQIVFIKELRRDIDIHIQKIKGSAPCSPEKTLSMRKLQEAVMWLGMELKRIAEQNPETLKNPYPDSKNPSNTNINPTADGLKL